MFHVSEQLVPTEHEKLFKAKFRTLDWAILSQALQDIQQACDQYQLSTLFALLKHLVPEFNDATLVNNVLPQAEPVRENDPISLT